MKKLIIVLVSIMFLLSSVSVFGGMDGRKKQYRKENGKYHRVYEKEHPINQRHGHAYGHYKKRDMKRFKGYKYNGHYSWKKWQKMRHDHKYNRGVYHHDDNGFLMFSFCENDRDRTTCFSISID